MLSSQRQVISFNNNNILHFTPHPVHVHTVSVVRGIEVSLTPYRLFSMLAFTYVGAMVASNSSLSFIPYPTQVRVTILTAPLK